MRPVLFSFELQWLWIVRDVLWCRGLALLLVGAVVVCDEERVVAFYQGINAVVAGRYLLGGS